MKNEQQFIFGFGLYCKLLEFLVSDYSKSDHSLHNYPEETAQH